jgi:hypothetical protein
MLHLLSWGVFAFMGLVGFDVGEDARLFIHLIPAAGQILESSRFAIIALSLSSRLLQ